MNCKTYFFASITFIFLNRLVAQQPINFTSPDKHITVSFWINDGGEALYNITHLGELVIKESKLGLEAQDADFVKAMKLIGQSNTIPVKDHYELFTGKKRLIDYAANQKILHLQSKEGRKLDIIFQLSNDGVAFRYYFPEHSQGIRVINKEITSFHFDTATRAFLQPMQVAKTGWEHTNPAYEEHYHQDILVTDSSTLGAGWVYPALFHYKNHWVLITEAALDGNYCATRLSSHSPDGAYRVTFPDPKEVIKGKEYLPQSALPFFSPWRVIAIGTLKTIAESTLGTDVANPAIRINTSFIKPGKASWSWIMSKDDSIVYSEQKRYIDFAAKMNWQYCLVDAAWDQKIGYEKIKELSLYAASKNVGLILWYNSAGDWNTVPYTPKDKLLTHADRVKEFTRLKEIGIRGLKIDFFGGDGQSVIKYYTDILNDAAEFQLLVNFHGATLPRGWERTYPNLVTMEAIKGFEFITFDQRNADVEASHASMLPFTRNAFDPMDFTPMNLYKIESSRVQRRTTSAFELATSVIFLSGIQHFAESPRGMEHVPDFVQKFLKELPVRWDDVNFIDGYPGKYVVLARKTGSKWYIACINGENVERTINLDLTAFKKKTGLLITDGSEPLTFSNEKFTGNKKQIKVRPLGGFVIVLE